MSERRVPGGKYFEKTKQSGKENDTLSVKLQMYCSFMSTLLETSQIALENCLDPMMLFPKVSVELPKSAVVSATKSVHRLPWSAVLHRLYKTTVYGSICAR